MLHKNKLSSAVALAVSSLVASQTFAQNPVAPLEEVLVTGIRGSLERAMDIKRESSGVVDAISAEDIGKFPDTNLAESLQRITGVSVSRQNGEGSKVTVRGFGEDYNMITLNGRTMPAADAPASGPASGRGFDFSQLASEAVSGVEVYKTGRADIASGGIGASINLRTARPLNNPGLNLSVGVKGVHDTTSRTGRALTPEVSGIVSWTNDSNVFGVGLALSRQERESGSAGAYVNGWDTRQWVDHDTDLASAMAVTINPETGERDIVNPPNEGQLYSTPSSIGYRLSDRERTRTNGQIVLQYEPSERITATVDYLYAKNETRSQDSVYGIWFTQNADRAVFDTDQAVATPVVYSEHISDTAGKDLFMPQMETHQTNELNSFGLNLELSPTDNLSLSLDYHMSQAESLPSAPWGGSSLTTGLGARLVGHHQGDFRGDLPVFAVTISDCGPGMNCDGQFTVDDLGSQVQQFYYSEQTTDVQQFRIDGTWELGSGAIQFGIENRSVENTTLFSNNINSMGDWGLANPGDIPNELLSPINFPYQYGDYSTTSDIIGSIPKEAWSGDAAQIARWGAEAYGFEFGPKATFDTDRLVKEDITAAYLQFDFSGDLGDFPFRALTGFRYEETEVLSESMLAIPQSITWNSNNDFTVNRDAGIQALSITSKYDHLLPSIDFSLDLTQDLVARMSASKTIARPTYNNLNSAVQVNPPSRPTTPGLSSAIASSGNPALVPLESTNFDLSLEWYYGDSNYASVGFFEKRVDNFIGNEPIERTLFDLRDPTSGPRAQAARAAIEARPDHDGVVDETELFTMVVAMENGLDYDSMDFNQTEIDYDVEPRDDDPLYRFSVDTPVNNESAKIHGLELAMQHFFGDSGFGIQANYTIVRGDVSFDNTGDPTISQFALVGLSDTANLVLIYESHGLSARLAYNWRDKYLADTNFSNRNPAWVEQYQQWDANISYDVNDNFQVFFEGLNLTEENFRSHSRSPRQLWNLEDLGARYQIGMRYTF